MRLAIKIFFLLLLLLLLLITVYYLLLPSPKFPDPPTGALRSIEPGDMETPYRRAYYTDYSRSEIIDHFTNRFYLPGQLLFNYPPEEAYTLIRDQTRSSWLQELVHPWRESLYINGFYPTKPSEQLYVDGVKYSNKITLRYVPSAISARLTVLMLTGVAIYLLRREYEKI